MKSSAALRLQWLGVLFICVITTLVIAHMALPNNYWHSEKITLALLAIILAECITFGWPILMTGKSYAGNSPRLPFNLGFAAVIGVFDLVTLLLVLSAFFLPVMILKIGMVLNIAFIGMAFLLFKIAQPSEKRYSENPKP